jgi:ketosteroid isomerase-like protein
MNAKELSQKGYDLFNSGDMESFFNDIVDDNITWTFPGDKHPLSGTHQGKQAMMEQMSKIPGLWDNFKVEPEFMIAEGNKVFTKVNAKADGMDTIFGHYAEYSEEGKLIHFMTFDETLSMFNAMK